MAMLGMTLMAVASCQKGGADLGDLLGAAAPIPPKLMAEIKAKDMGGKSPILVRLYKEESQLEIWKQKSNGEYAVLKTYSICAWSGKLGPKKTAGDRQAPEGFYTVAPGQMNPDSQHHLAFNIGYPNQFDKVNGGTGEHLMVHGSCNSSGCYAMDDWQMEELYALAREAFAGGQRSFQIQAYPFRMTPKNMARHRQSEHYAFWKVLKEGSDRFELTKKPVTVGVCEKRYAFDPKLGEGQVLLPTGPCPTEEEPVNVAAKRIADEAEEEKLFATMKPTDFATVSTFAYKPGMPITAEAYAAEQHRRPGFDRLGKPVEEKRRSVFAPMTTP
ncbi:L,D-transpeptidase family protein [Aureimonas psammosilenae]|uniref:L,D-transpeptidase family protein n=1 Tax=Aureimonas psammosilenae TaxID=2495496 RepID=UPI001260C33B|nr:murein L,D-transpeptidase family protein [Aureimonas psammosilenae]